MMFNIDDYKGKYVMHCKTEEEAKDFCNFLHSQGREWSTGESYFNETYWNDYEESTCYEFNEDLYCSKRYFKEKGYTILEMEDFNKVVAKHIFLAHFKHESSREIIILADNIDEARQKAQNFLGLSSVIVRAIDPTDDPQIYEL